jgi:hypothetical protein
MQLLAPIIVPVFNLTPGPTNASAQTQQDSSIVID